MADAAAAAVASLALASSSSDAGDAASAVRVQYFGPDRGFGMVTNRPVEQGEVRRMRVRHTSTHDVSRDENRRSCVRRGCLSLVSAQILFTEYPAACFQANSSLAPSCGSVRCMRLLGGVEELVRQSHAVYQAATGQAPVLRGSSAQARSQLAQLAQNNMPTLRNPIVRCRTHAASNSGGHSGCEARFCSAACEEEAWTHGHAVLCVGANPAMAAFFAARNVVRNADVHVAAQIIAAFICEVSALHAASSLAAAAADDGAAAADDGAAASGGAVDRARVLALWGARTSYHAVPWSSVLAVQAVSSQQLVPLRIVDAHVRDLARRDALEHRAAEEVTTIGVLAPQSEAAPASAASSSAATPDIAPSDLPLFTSLQSAQVQYRGALAEVFALLRSGLLGCSAGSAQGPVQDPLQAHKASQSLWAPFVTLPTLDLLAGANRLNCTLTQTALPFPHPMPKPASSTKKAAPIVNLATAGAESDDDEDETKKKDEEDVPLLVSSLESLFAPMALPLANAKGLFMLHSKMNHSCGAGVGVVGMGVGGAGAASATARVENWTEATDIAWSASSVPRAQSSEQARMEKAKASAGGNKKKKQKARKNAAATEARLLAQEERDRTALESMAQQLESNIATAAASSSSSSSSSPSAAARHSCQIVVRALRRLEAGDEVLINYLPPSAALAHDDQARREYLHKHYLFACQCDKCTPSKDNKRATSK